MSNNKQSNEIEIYSDLYSSIYYEIFNNEFYKIFHNNVNTYNEYKDELKKVYKNVSDSIYNEIYDNVYKDIKEVILNEWNNNRNEILNSDQKNKNKIIEEIKKKIKPELKTIIIEKINEIIKLKIESKYQELINEKEKNQKDNNISNITTLDIKNIQPNIIEEKKEKISLGINIGSLNTVYSIFSKDDGRFKTNVILSDVSKRVIPTQICYSDTQILYGETASPKMGKFCDFSYSNLSRLIGFDIDCEYFKNEFVNFFNFGKYDRKSKKFKIGEKKEESSSIIIADFLSLINKFYFDKVKKEENFKYDFVTFSVPDYFTAFQKKELKLIAEAIGMKNINIINESSAITMYYGYNKYRDMFVSKKTNVDKTIKKNVIFIDIGYSKTTFIFSTFNYAYFKVKYVKTLPYFGGRNLDEKIYKECIDNFLKKETLSSSEKDKLMNNKNKTRLLQAIKKAREALSINKDTTILTESFFEELDIEYPIKKEEFLELIKEDLELFKKELKNFKEKIMNFIEDKNNLIIEMAGELMRTPIFQEITEKVFNIKLSKQILIDECTSVGAALYGYYINNKLPINTFKQFYDYNNYTILFDVDDKDKNIEFKKIGNNEEENYIYAKLIKDIKMRNNMNFFFKYKKDEIEKFSKIEELYKYKINIAQLKKDNNNFEEYYKLIIEPKLNYSDEIELKIYFINQKNEKKECKYLESINLEEGCYFSNQQIENKKAEIKNIIIRNRESDQKYVDYSEKRNDIQRKITELKNKKDPNIMQHLKTLNELESRIKKLDKKELKEKQKELEEIENIMQQLEKGEYISQNFNLLEKTMYVLPKK